MIELTIVILVMAIFGTLTAEILSNATKIYSESLKRQQFISEARSSFFKISRELSWQKHFKGFNQCSEKNILINKSIIEKRPTNFQLNTLRSKWSYQYDQKKYNNYSFEEAEKLMTDKMMLLYSLLKKNNISLSIAVYPWPSTIYYEEAQKKAA